MMTSAAQESRSSLPYRLTLALGVLLVIAGIPFLVDFILHPLQVDADYGLVTVRVAGIISCLITVTIGFLCVRRVPGNIIGPLLVIFGASQSFSSVRNTVSPDLIVFAQLVGPPFFWTTYPLLLTAFPTGRPHFRRLGTWSNYAWILIQTVLAAGYILGIGTFTYIAPDSIKVVVANPYIRPWGEVILGFAGLAFALFASPYTILIFVSQILRYRAAGQDVRQQIKWFLLGISLWIGPLIITSLIPSLPEWLSNTTSAYYIVGASLFPPAAIGIGILRYRLYDIDIIIRRTLIYSVLTAILALIYFGGIVLAQGLLRAVTGGNSDAAIVISTLVIAALFTPLRRRIQDMIDRRFYRRKYDAERTLAAFNATMRDEVDLDKLQAALVNVVQETMQPTQVSLWLKDPSPFVKKEQGS